VCDNFGGSNIHAAVGSKAKRNLAKQPVEALLATSPAKISRGKIMVEELEKEYATLKDKVRELREYL
jgi:hypothetical protein